MSVQRTLSKLELFRGIGIEKIGQVVECCFFEYCPANYTVFKEGDLLTHLYVVEQGTVKMTVDVRQWPGKKPGKMAVKTIQAGDVFGWAAVLDPPRAFTSALALPKTTLIAIDGAKLREFLIKESPLAYNMMAELFRSVLECGRVNNSVTAMDWAINAANS